eukprot:1510592-Amphidinium_carterae.1
MEHISCVKLKTFSLGACRNPQAIPLDVVSVLLLLQEVTDRTGAIRLATVTIYDDPMSADEDPEVQKTVEGLLMRTVHNLYMHRVR